MKTRAERFMPNDVPRYVRIYDNGGETADRYTVVFTGLRTGWHQLLSMSAAPFHPQRCVPAFGDRNLQAG